MKSLKSFENRCRDLYERLNFVPVHVPPLRDRREDIPLLLRHCLEQHDDGRWIGFGDDVATFLTELDFTWPGNVRHLEQLAARLVLERPEGPAAPALLERLLGQDLARDVTANGGPSAPELSDLERGLPALLAESERLWLEEALRRYPALSRAELARLLKISETTLFKKLRQHGFTG